MANVVAKTINSRFELRCHGRKAQAVTLPTIDLFTREGHKTDCNPLGGEDPAYSQHFTKTKIKSPLYQI